MDEFVCRQALFPDAIQSLHYHDAFELGYCYSGTGLFLIDGEIVPFREGAAVMIYRGQLHKAQSTSREWSEWVFLSADLPLMLSEDVYKRQGGGHQPHSGVVDAQPVQIVLW